MKEITFFILILFNSALFAQEQVLARFDRNQTTNSSNIDGVLTERQLDNISKKMFAIDVFDSSSVVDSVVVSKKNGDKEKYLYTYDGKGKITSYLFVI